jgi:hypothetical protein
MNENKKEKINFLLGILLKIEWINKFLIGGYLLILIIFSNTKYLVSQDNHYYVESVFFLVLIYSLLVFVSIFIEIVHSIYFLSHSQSNFTAL